MSRNVTLTQLLADVASQADFVGAATTGRYPNTIITRYINQSIQRFRERISNEGSTHFLVSTTGTLTPGATSPYPFGVLDLSALSPSLVRTYGVDITLPGSRIKTLSHTPFTERASFGGPLNTDEPRAWAHYQTRKIAILPPPNQGYTYVVWYLPVLTDLASGSDTFDGVAGWEDWIVWDVVCRTIIRDQYASAFATASQYRLETWADIVRSATKVSSAGGAVLGRDSMGARGPRGMRGQKGWLPPP